jgi:hypothetical protein
VSATTTPSYSMITPHHPGLSLCMRWSGLCRLGSSATFSMRGIGFRGSGADTGPTSTAASTDWHATGLTVEGTVPRPTVGLSAVRRYPAEGRNDRPWVQLGCNRGAACFAAPDAGGAALCKVTIDNLHGSCLLVLLKLAGQQRKSALRGHGKHFDL